MWDGSLCRSNITSRYHLVVDIDSDLKIHRLTPTLGVALRSDSYDIHKILRNKDEVIVSLMMFEEEEEEGSLFSDMMVEKVPDSMYEMVGGFDKQIEDIKEVIELCGTHPEHFGAFGIAQPKGVLLYGSRYAACTCRCAGANRENTPNAAAGGGTVDTIVGCELPTIAT